MASISSKNSFNNFTKELIRHFLWLGHFPQEYASLKLRHDMKSSVSMSTFLVSEEGRPVRIQAGHLGCEAGVTSVSSDGGRGGGRGRPGPSETLLNPR